jgi:diguanylate cyclase (GGDEF)-like protein
MVPSTRPDVPLSLRDALREERADDNRRHLLVLACVATSVVLALAIQHVVEAGVPRLGVLWWAYVVAYGAFAAAAVLAGMLALAVMPRLAARARQDWALGFGVLFVACSCVLTALDLRYSQDTSAFAVGVLVLAAAFRAASLYHGVVVVAAASAVLAATHFAGVRLPWHVMQAIGIIAAFAWWIARSLEKRRVQAFLLRQELAARSRELEALSSHDPLTGAVNRRALLDRLDLLVAQSRRYATPLAVAVIDIDHFKSINDSQGHPAGDEILKDFTGLLVSGTRASDIVARVGGEEFVVVMSSTPVAHAQMVAERLRRRVATQSFPAWTRGVTASIGIAEFRSEDSVENLLKRADDALYASKRQGRDRVTVG